MPNFENVTPTRIEIPEIGVIAEAGQVITLSADDAAVIGADHPDLTPTKAKATPPAEDSATADPASAPTDSADVEDTTSAAPAASTEGA